MSEHIRVTHSGGASVFELPGEVTISLAEAMRVELLAELESVDGDLEIDASELRTVDTCGAQLLTALNFELQLKQINVIWKSPQLAVLDMFKRLDLAQQISFQPQN